MIEDNRGSITTALSPDSKLAKINTDRMIKHIEDCIRESCKDYVGKFNTKQNQIEMQAQIKKSLIKIAEDNLAVVDRNGEEITAKSVVIEGDTIIVPQPAALVPRWMIGQRP